MAIPPHGDAENGTALPQDLSHKNRDSADPALGHFSAQVISCEPDGKGTYVVLLDETAFYPKGGGQPADRGILGGANVLDVHERGESIAHTTDAPLCQGARVEGIVDWARRFDHMQQHTGEHIVSGIVHALYGLDNVGFHMGALVTVDFNGELTRAQLDEIERRANEAVWANLPVRVSYPSREELDTLDYRSKKELTGQVRIVTVPGIDVCACCGTHVAATGQVGLIHITDAQRYKGGTRLTLVCGSRALRDYAGKDAALSESGALLSAKMLEVPAAVERTLAELSRLRQEAASQRAALLEVKARETPRQEGNLLIFEEDLPPDALRQYAVLLAERCGGIAGALSSDGNGGLRYALASRERDVRPFVKEMNAALHGRGGGKKELAQGALSCTREEARQFWAAQEGETK